MRELFLPHEKELRSTLYRRLSSTGDVEDVLQETFVKALTVIDWNRVENRGAYLLRTALNLVNDFMRGKHRNVLTPSNIQNKIGL